MLTSLVTTEKDAQRVYFEEGVELKGSVYCLRDV